MINQVSKEIRGNGYKTRLKNILVVDDERFLLSLISESLSIDLRDCNILTAENGREAVEVLKSYQVDLIVTDLKMPVMDGRELLEYVKKNHPEIPSFVISADLTQETKDALSSMGARQFFSKPFNLRTLGLRVAYELENKSGTGIYEETSAAMAHAEREFSSRYGISEMPSA